MGINATKIRDFSIKKLPSLRILGLSIFGTIDENILTPILEQLPHIEELTLNGKLSHFNLDNLVDLKSLTLSFTLDTKSFNFELFKNLCNRLTNIQIDLSYIDEETFVKLFDGYNFTHLEKFTLKHFNAKRLKKEFFNRFTTLRHLCVTCCKFETIERDSFSDLKQLCSLNLSRNQISHIGRNAFGSLENLQTLDLSYNDLRYLYVKPMMRTIMRYFVGLRKSVELNIEHNI